MHFFKLISVIGSLGVVAGFCSCSSTQDDVKIPYYDEFTYKDLTNMMNSIAIDLSLPIIKSDPVQTDEPKLLPYITTAKSNQYTAVYIMTGMYPDKNGLLYNYYTENNHDYYFEQFVLCNDDVGNIQQEDITFLLGVSNSYYESDSAGVLAETNEAKQLALFFEDFTYSEAYTVNVGDSLFHCEIWLKDSEHPYYFYFRDDELLAAQTYSSSDKEICYYFTEFNSVPQADRLQ